MIEDIHAFHNAQVWRQLEDLRSSDRGAVYILRCLVTGAIYVGYTTKTVRERFNSHFAVMYKDKPRKRADWNLMNKHVRSNCDENLWMFSIPYRSDRRDDLADYEIDLIRAYREAGAKVYDILNSTNGGEGYHPQIFAPEDDNTFILMKKVVDQGRAAGLGLNTDIMARLALQFPDVDHSWIRQALSVHGDVSNVGIKVSTSREINRLHTLGYGGILPYRDILSILNGSLLHTSDVVSDNIIRFLSSDTVPKRALSTNVILYTATLRQIALEPMTIDQIVQSTLGDS